MAKSSAIETRLRLKVLSAREYISQISDIAQNTYIHKKKIQMIGTTYYIYVISSKSKGKTAYDCEKISKS